ncbi:serine hydrolase [Candidatus Daviesbacteria bacterium]|nr:serine hydrolase [Candidatus Daviesbacteria bacterium]
MTVLGNLGSQAEDLLNPYINSETKGVVITPLGKIVSSVLRGTEGRYGIFIKNLTTGENFFLNADQTFESGSLYKLKLMVLTFEQIKQGGLSENETLTADIEELNKFFEIPKEDAEFEEGVIQFSIKSALEQMITISHNYAALALTKKIGAKNLAEPITPGEVGSFFEDLYNGKVIDGDYSKQMLELLSRQKINDRIPKLLPKEVKVAHKTADLDYFEHDSGIVFSPKGDYIMVVLTESKIPDAAGRKTAELSKAVYGYFNRVN